MVTNSHQHLLRYLSKHAHATIADIMVEFGFKSRTAVHWHVRKLEALGLIERPVVKRSGWIVKQKR